MGGVDPLAQAGDAHLPLEHGAVGRRPRAVVSSWSRSRGRRRASGTRLTSPWSTPRLRLHDEVRHVEPELLDRPASDRIVPARKRPGQMGMEALDALAGPAHTARRPRARVPDGQGPVPFGAVAGVRVGERVGVHGGLGAGARLRRPPACSPPRAARRRRASTGSAWDVPSSSNGALTITAGRPSRRRTATVNSPEGERPSSRVTASRSDSPSGRGGGISSRTPGFGPPVPSSCAARCPARAGSLLPRHLRSRAEPPTLPAGATIPMRACERAEPGTTTGPFKGTWPEPGSSEPDGLDDGRMS